MTARVARFVLCLAGPLLFAQDHSSHEMGVNSRGDRVMGFAHDKTTHHFLLRPDGGAIQVEANDAHDKVSRDQIRQHLSHIAGMFANGNFNAPLLIHDRVPPGVPVLQERRALITWQFAKTPRGGVVRISTKDEAALHAIHEFLRFQISDHGTGDPPGVSAAGGRE